jgi:centractin
MDIRRTLYDNILLSGGNTNLNEFAQRFIGEVKKLIPKDIKVIYNK